MSAPSSTRIPRDAKKKALENAVWNHWQVKGGRSKAPTAKKTPKDMTPKDCPPMANLKAAKKTTGRPTQKTRPTATMSKGKSSSKRRHTPHESDEEDLERSDELEDTDTFIRKKARLAQRGARDSEAHHRDSDGKDSADEIDSDAIARDMESGSDIDEGEDEMPETIAKLMDNEVPFAPSQYRHQQLARDRKQTTETPTWAKVAVSESHETSDASEQESEPESPKSPSVQGSSKSKSHSTSTALAHIVVAEGGNIKLLDQNLETRRVVKGAIMEAKCQLVFVDGFPELVDKNQLSYQSLLTVAAQHNLCEIEKRLRTDEDYISQLASLVDARIPILRRELKDDACAKVSGYFRLGHIDVEKAKNLMAHNVPSPIRNKPYQGEILIALIFGRVFNGSQSIGVRFAKRFADLAENNAKRPEVPIPLVALVATAVYAALVWKSMGSPSKFNFSGNQFSETYFFHVKFLQNLKDTVPRKFHHMMADIYEAVQCLKCAGGAEHTVEQDAALDLLDLDGMDDD
ncbi:hypothetical protein F4604DRAFT_1920403 [Suillus subluteus]|nr:hypothetical protein F4604DRAFT_1920403 [Suillus subluteus]